MKQFIFFLILILTFSQSNMVFANYFERSDKGIPISEAERQKATDELIAIFKDTSFFDFVDSRVHGIPESDSSKSFWWASMWTGVRAQKLNGRVTYIHSNDGTDNAGIHTSPYLEGACYAYLLTGDQRYAYLARRLMRGLSSWILSSARSINETPKILSRSFYPESVHSLEGGRDIYINYDASRPGINGEASQYVHIPNNPSFGDIWIKNKRSVDDIGHMIRAIAQVQACRNVFDKDGKADLDQMNDLYSTWATVVDSSRFIIPSYDLNAEPFLGRFGIGDYNTYKLGPIDPSCVGKLAVRYLHSADAQDMDCGKGISFLEKIGNRYLKNDAIEILRSHHVAAIAMADLKLQKSVAEKLKQGLAERMDRDLKIARSSKVSPKFDIQDVPTFLIHANNVGVPMTSEEIRFVYERLHSAYIGMRTPANYNTFHLFDSSVPDGMYSFDPPNTGLYFYTLGPMIGACTSAFHNPNSRLPFDCERLKKALMKW